MHNSTAHTALIRETLQKLALAGYTAWQNQTGAWIDDNGVPHKFGKTGSADIFLLLPIVVQFASGLRRTVAWHIECEAKTGTGRQSPNQKLHQEFCVERNGGVYILFRSSDELLEKLKELKNA